MPFHDTPTTTPRQGRAGYLKWRADLKRAHADTVAAVMSRHGYGGGAVERVKRMINKLDVNTDPENQVGGCAHAPRRGSGEGGGVGSCVPGVWGAGPACAAQCAP